ncbi:MAG: hypothetical protein PSW75_08850 [bacterium]|nr:hypothetical protein [bacterium]MDI1338084.1 hypothetical protein [Lacunisphaera sp.]
MTAFDPIVFHQLPVIRQIVRDETWLEGERRGCTVPPDDRLVRANVCSVVLRIGAQLRESAQRASNARADSPLVAERGRDRVAGIPPELCAMM